MNKARIQTTPHNSVTYHLPEGHALNPSLGPVNREFFIPKNGGTIRESCGNHQFTQVCQRLERYGNTLTANSTHDLLPLIRTQHRRALAYKRHQQSPHSSNQPPP